MVRRGDQAAIAGAAVDTYRVTRAGGGHLVA